LLISAAGLPKVGILVAKRGRLIWSGGRQGVGVRVGVRVTVMQFGPK
jgi:hypothetical protein